MKDSILILIEDNIVNVKLMEGLDKLGIDASLYYLNSPTVIFKLIGIDNNIDKDELYKIYFEWLRTGESIDFSESRKELKKYAEKVYSFLESHK